MAAQSAFELISRLLPVLIPLAIVQLALIVAAMVHILKHEKYKTGNRLVWIIIVLAVNTVGPILYFIFGRSEGGEEEDA